MEQNHRPHEVVLAQVRLLYANTDLAAVVTVVAATILCRLQWALIPKSILLGWWIYMALVSAARFALTLAFRKAAPGRDDIRGWFAAYIAFAGMAGAGWGTAGVLLYPETQFTNQVFLVFVLGGMMLGGASLLAARPEAFLAFLVPAGLAPSVRLMLHGDETHLSMGILSAMFTIVLLVTTARIYRTIDSSIRLQFEKQDLLQEVQAAQEETEALNQQLELRVQERTAELRQAAENLQAEISHREQMEEELLRVRKLESLGVLAGGIAHDFNNFLTIIQGNIEVAKERAERGQPVQGLLDETVNTCRRAEFLASQLLTFAKGGAPVRHLSGIGKLVGDAVQLVRAGATVSVTTEVAGDLKCAYVDPAQIVQVLHNILLNARQAMPEGGIIEVRAENVPERESGAADPRIRISIRDYGIGINPDHLSRIFDPYFTTKPGASGLGLATAHAIVSKHGGHILVDSEPGVGTKFTVELPATNDLPAPQAPAEEPQRGTGRVLVMDDEEALRQLLTTVLTKLGYEVEAARDGAEAIAMYEREKAADRGFDVVLLDLTVSGGMGGLEAAAKLKELDPAAKLIVSSGYSAAPVMSEYRKYGFDAVIPKPWTKAALSEVLRRVLVGVRDT